MFFGFGCDRAGVYVVAIEVIACKDVFVAGGGWYSEVAGLVGVDGACDGLAGGVDVMCAFVLCVLWLGLDGGGSARWVWRYKVYCVWWWGGE